ncbi:MAG: carbamoyl phosphate synthase large subunit, partial [Desulfatitalea sp.]|nr:carbamoyl phosphate synthase large subunit [Desulfatitalea sp.]NNK00167.1 carbamoyl phosphate synthase large subunit [Desulfatitalea sp.]
AQLGAGQKLPVQGTVFISVMDADKPAIVSVAKEFTHLNFSILTTSGTGDYLRERGVASKHINKLDQGRPNVEDAVKNGEIQMVINTGSGDTPSRDGYIIRRAALKFGVPYVTTAAGALAVCKAVTALKTQALGVKCLQAYHEQDAGNS